MFDFRPAGRGPFAVRLAKIKTTDTVLNVGCFNGLLERYFLNGKCAAYFGVDANEEAVQYASKHSPGGRFKVAYAESLPFADNTFDKVFCLDTLEHVNDEKKSLREIWRVLKPGGTLIISVPHDFLNFLDPDELTRDMRNIVRKYIRKKELLTHPKHRHYSEEQLRTLLKDFDIEHVHKSGTPVFWGLAMLYTAFGIPEQLTTPLRKITDPLENADYALNLPTGFNIMIRAIKRA
jgi:SAM-dependent methyltransferase